jgi:hypothetical protein
VAAAACISCAWLIRDWVPGSGFRIQGSGFRIKTLEFNVWGSGFGVRGSGFGVWGYVIKVQRLEF